MFLRFSLRSSALTKMSATSPDHSLVSCARDFKYDFTQVTPITLVCFHHIAYLFFPFMKSKNDWILYPLVLSSSWDLINALTATKSELSLPTFDLTHIMIFLISAVVLGPLTILFLSSIVALTAKFWYSCSPMTEPVSLRDSLGFCLMILVLLTDQSLSKSQRNKNIFLLFTAHDSR